MSLLAFLLRSPNEALKNYKDHIPEYVVRLLKDCPPELSSARKVKAVYRSLLIFLGTLGRYETYLEYRFPRGFLV